MMPGLHLTLNADVSKQIKISNGTAKSQRTTFRIYFDTANFDSTGY